MSKKKVNKFKNRIKTPILITGSTGFIGANLTRKLVNLGYKIVIIVRPNSNLWRIDDLKKENIPYEKSEFPWQASGKAISIGRTEGKTKILFEPESKRVIGVGIIGYNAGDLIGEAVLAIEMGCYAEDIALTIHPHPTLTETFSNTAEVMEKTITDLYIK